MAKFEAEGRSYNTEDFSGHQKNLISSLSITKGLIEEITFKRDLFLEIKKELDPTLKKEFGSKIKDISGHMPSPQLTLASGKKIKFSELSENLAANVRHLSFLNEQINFYSNQLQVLDTAQITYSKNFYETLPRKDES